ncbi:heparinase II/III family protein [Thiohalocapsa marina]|uniref:heparinase II/III family protein n=1 Tax=Thiohalocapsa marina TaxID=424902 RepID=UPI0036DF06CB
MPSSSLATQARWLRKRLEHHLLGNHLFANAKALIFAGAFFEGAEAECWLALGQRLLRRELNEQILADGGHFERSPMYHAILLEDVLDVLNLAGVYPGVLDDALLALCRVKAVAMLDWLAAMTHPDGEISFFNDAAFGIAPTLADLGAYAEQLGIGARADSGGYASLDPAYMSESGGYASLDPPYASTTSVIPAGKPESRAGIATLPLPNALELYASPPSLALGPVFPAGTTDVECRWLRDSGYVRLQAGPAVALLDCAPIGPDYLPGHAHADTLSFELSLFGQRVIVNGGTSRYGSGPERLAERGTAAHSTVQVDGAESSEVWGGFRVARRARPFDVRVRDAKARFCTEPGFEPPAPALQVSAAHDGYSRLPGRPVHRRDWLLTEDRLRVTDRVEGEVRSAVARFHLHPAIEARVFGKHQGPEGVTWTGTFQLPDGVILNWQATGGTATLTPDQWHPEFGRSLPSQCLEIELTDSECIFEIRWAFTTPEPCRDVS